MKYLVFDISNLLYRTFFVNKKEDDETIAGLATHMALNTLNKYYKQFKPHKVVMVFDRSSWRKAYAASDETFTSTEYKGSRKAKRDAMTPTETAKYQRFLNHLREFESLMTEHSSIVTLAENELEADDLIAGFVQKMTPEHEVILVSTDSDFAQLLKHKNLTIISPETGKPVTLEDFNNDPEYFLFVKCIRGDKTDDVMSAFPRVQQKRLHKAYYEDPYEMTVIMETKWTDKDKVEHTVKNIYNENRVFIDLSMQPDHIKQLIGEVLNRELSKEKKFSFFHFMKFLGKYDLKKVADNIDQFTDLLSR